MRLRQWSWWTVTAAFALWLVAGLALIGWSALVTAKGLEAAQPSGEQTLTMVRVEPWQLGLLLVPPLAFLVFWVGSGRGRG
jgi:hypothetical protein